MRYAFALFSILFAARAALAAHPGFASKPSARQAGGKTTVSFAVKSSCDGQTATGGASAAL